jgi:hypothetical protein
VKTCEVDESEEVLDVAFPSGDESAEVVHPGKEPLDITKSALRMKRGLNRPNVEALRLQSRCRDLFR